MKSTPLHATRRAALRQLLIVAGAAAAWPARADSGPPHLSPSDPQAVKLGYTEDAARVDAKKYPAFDPAQSCDNCLQLQGKSGPDYRPCELFPRKLVAVKGWCSGWTAEI